MIIGRRVGRWFFAGSFRLPILLIYLLMGGLLLYAVATQLTGAPP
jgi:hypothetical protein